MNRSPDTFRMPLPRRVHALVGALPLAAFLAIHVLANASACFGDQAFTARVTALRFPGVAVAEIALIGVPLAYHATYGLYATIVRRAPRGAPSPWQSISGIVTLLFVAYHFWHLRLATATGRLLPTDYAAALAESLSSTTALGVPGPALIYLTGVGAVSLHVALGLTAFCRVWGLTPTERAERRARLVFGIFAATLFAIAASTIMVFARGAVVESTPRAAPRRLDMAPLHVHPRSSNQRSLPRMI